MLLEDEASDDKDVDFHAEEWKIIRHVVDSRDKKTKFLVHNGKREDGRDKHLWGEYDQLKG